MSAVDVACPSCQAAEGAPCVSRGHAPAGSPMKRFHAARYAAAPVAVIECGTYAGYQRHSRRHELACQPCREAAARYAKTRRARQPDAYAEEKRKDAARQRALWRLAGLHYGDFQRLVREELAS